MKPFPFASAAFALLACVVPLRAETLAPVYSFAMPPRSSNEFTVGLSTDGTDLYLFTTITHYTSPFDVGGDMNFVSSGFIWVNMGVRMGPRSLALFNPTNAEQYFITGGSGFFDNDLYTVTQPDGLPPVVESVALSGVGLKPTGIAAADGGGIYLSSPDAGAGIYRLPNADTGTPDLNFGNTGLGALNTPSALAFGPDSLLYVLDTGDNRIVSFDADGVYQNAFGLLGSPLASALAIDNDGRLFTLNEDGSGDIYDVYTGTHIGYLAKPEDPFSTGGNRAFLFYNDGYLYSLPMNADNVWVYAIPEPSVTALLIGGGALAFASFRRRVRRG